MDEYKYRMSFESSYAYESDSVWGKITVWESGAKTKLDGLGSVDITLQKENTP